MAKFNSGTISREEALNRARILRDSLNFYEDNPTVDEDKAEQIGNVFTQLVNDHKLTPEELAGDTDSSTSLVKLKDPVETTQKDPVSLYYDQPAARTEWHVNRANGRDRDHELALPFELGYKQSTGEFDAEGLGKIVDQRREEFDPSDHPEVNDDQMDNLREATAWGMDPDSYKGAIERGIPHDDLMKVFINSARAHTIQYGAAKDLGSIRGLELSETPAGAAAAQYKEENKGPGSKSTALKPDQFIPIRVSVMKPANIADAYRAGVSTDEMLDAWNNNGFHPLANFGTNNTFPMTKYIAARGMGIDHEQARGLLSSLRHIPLTQFKSYLQAGDTPEQALDQLNDYKNVPLGKPEEQKAIQE